MVLKMFLISEKKSTFKMSLTRTWGRWSFPYVGTENPKMDGRWMGFPMLKWSQYCKKFIVGMRESF